MSEARNTDLLLSAKGSRLGVPHRPGASLCPSLRGSCRGPEKGAQRQGSAPSSSVPGPGQLWGLHSDLPQSLTPKPLHPLFAASWGTLNPSFQWPDSRSGEPGSRGQWRLQLLAKPTSWPPQRGSSFSGCLWEFLPLSQTQRPQIDTCPHPQGWGAKPEGRGL